ncbi:hypothetical protein [Vibrio vulnificus]|uniref:hypothetical protein n=1 Tax=Vibrio vulnificus TaxID=672 RepID=UPI003EDB29BA
MDEITTAMQSVKLGISLLSDTIGLVKKTKDALPESGDKEAIERSLEEAAKATKLAEAQIAQALGYKLCQCTFPPQIMLSAGYIEYQEVFKCRLCGKSSQAPQRPLSFL